MNPLAPINILEKKDGPLGPADLQPGLLGRITRTARSPLAAVEGPIPHWELAGG